MEESKLKLDAMWLSVSEMEAEAVRLRTSQAQEETVRRLLYEEARKRLGFTEPDLEDPEPESALSPAPAPCEEEGNVVTELFDEVLQQKKKHPVRPRQEPTDHLQDSIKDSIIRPGEDEEKYDTLDREPQPGHDSEIDSYLGEDQPGEFDTFFG